jgi:hypothetical protein
MGRKKAEGPMIYGDRSYGREVKSAFPPGVLAYVGA